MAAVPTRVPTSHKGIRPVVPVSDMDIFSKNKKFQYTLLKRGQ
jgi:hypothetical protein